MEIPLLNLKAQYATIEQEIKNAIDRVLKSQIFILGPEVAELEKEVALYTGSRYGIGVASGSDALLVSLMALNIGDGDRVITTPYTFFATAGSISRVGATPIFVDIDPATYNIDPEKVRELLEDSNRLPPIKAIIPVHLFGQCADMNAIMDLSRKYELRVIEDAAQAIGAKYGETANDKNQKSKDSEQEIRKAGNIGDLGCFSFFPSKNLGGFGDGGMVVTDDEDLGKKIKILRTHGSKPKYYHKLIGLNSRLDSLQAAVLRIKLKYLEGWTRKRQTNANYYNQLFQEAGLAGNAHSRQDSMSDPVILPFTRKGNVPIFNQYVIRVKKRDELRSFLKDNGIASEIYYPIPLHRQECYRHLGYKEGDFPESERAAKETIALPIYPELTEKQQEYLVNKIKDFITSA